MWAQNALNPPPVWSVNMGRRGGKKGTKFPSWPWRMEWLNCWRVTFDGINSTALWHPNAPISGISKLHNLPLQHRAIKGLVKSVLKMQPSKTELCQDDWYYGKRENCSSNNSSPIQQQQAFSWPKYTFFFLDMTQNPRAQSKQTHDLDYVVTKNMEDVCSNSPSSLDKSRALSAQPCGMCKT